MARAIKAYEEGQTPIDDLSELRLKIKTQTELDAAEYENNLKARQKYLFKKVTPKYAPFAYPWFLRVHKDMFGDVWSWAGKPRKSEKNVGVKPYQILPEITNLVSDLRHWEKEGMEIVEIVARLHHRTVAIHPFENGNGRFARMIIDIYLHKKGLKAIVWPTDRDYVRKVFRPRYLSTLKAADKGDYAEFIKLHSEHFAQ